MKPTNLILFTFVFGFSGFSLIAKCDEGHSEPQRFTGSQLFASSEMNLADGRLLPLPAASLSDFIGKTKDNSGARTFDVKLEKGAVVDAGDIVVLGLKFWNLISDGTAAASFEENQVHALPAAAHSAMELSGWKSSSLPSITTRFSDPIGGTAAQFSYALSFSSAGVYHGQGHYLANVTIIPGELDVKSLYEMKATVKVLDPLNVGTRRDPVAQLKLLMSMRVRDKLIGGEKWIATVFTVAGDGTSTVESLNAKNSGDEK